MTAAPDLVVQPLTPARWKDLEAIFNARGCSIARGCWCMYYRLSGRENSRDQRKARLKRLARADPPAGLIGYRERSPVGWISLGPREAFARLQRSPVMKAVDAQAVWSIVCFVVPSQFRGQGVAAALLQGAIAFARKRGVAILEAYPVDKARRSADDFMWFGAKSMYDAAGFQEVARRRPARPVVRLHLGRTGRALVNAAAAGWDSDDA
jgi:ribosomal protein S18 acetylase RimI-like enzyme